MDETQSTWSETAQQWGSMLLDRYTAKEFAVPKPAVAPYGVQAIDPATGRPYVEGRPATGGTVLGLKMSPMLLIGAAVAVVAVVMLTRKG